MSETKRPFPDAARLAELREWAEGWRMYANAGAEHAEIACWLDTLALIDLAASLEWHDGSELPSDDRTVQIDLGNGVLRIGCYDIDMWIGSCGGPVLRWRELPR